MKKSKGTLGYCIIPTALLVRTSAFASRNLLYFEPLESVVEGLPVADAGSAGSTQQA
jgi:hypothetical protein